MRMLPADRSLVFQAARREQVAMGTFIILACRERAARVLATAVPPAEQSA